MHLMSISETKPVGYSDQQEICDLNHLYSANIPTIKSQKEINE